VVWYPARLSSMGSDTPQDLVLLGLIPCRIWFCWVWYPAGFGSAGSDTPQDLVLLGLIPCRIWFCWESDPVGILRPRGIRWKSFESLLFPLMGHFPKIVCMYKLHYPRHIGFMLKTFLFGRAWHPVKQLLNTNIFKNSNHNFIFVKGMNQGPIWGRFSKKKTETENLVLLYLLMPECRAFLDLISPAPEWNKLTMPELVRFPE
jgi:hypothetical protein